MTKKRQSVGKWGERVAENYLKAKGYRIRSRNVRTPHGEIDLIAEFDQLDQLTVVFVEVKTRTTGLYGPPEEAVNARKINHLKAAIEYYMQENPSDTNWRLDVIAIEQLKQDDPVITHFENAITV
jgi:putative endonuclease